MPAIKDQVKERFAQEVAAGGTQSEAYRRANPKANRWKPQSVYVESSKLIKLPEVRLRVEELKAESAERVILSRGWVIEQLMENATLAKAASDFTAANKALELLGKTDELAMFEDRRHVTSDNRNHNIEERVPPTAEWLEGVLGGASEGAHPKSRSH